MESSDINLLSHMSSPIAKSVECSCEEIMKQTPNQSLIFAIFVEYSGEKNMVDVYMIYNSTVGSHRISNEVRRNKSSTLAALLLTS